MKLSTSKYGVFETLFGGGGGQQQQQPQNNQQQQNPNDPTKQPQKQGTGQPSGEQSQVLEGAGANGKVAASPLDPYKDLFKIEPEVVDPNNPNNKVPQPRNYAEVAKQINFSRLIPQDLMAKALQGDVPSFAQIIDTVGRASFAASTKMADQISAESGKKFSKDFEASLPDKFRSFSLNNTPIKNSVLSNPAVKPLVEAIRLQMAQKFPEASTDELQANAEKYFMAVHQELGKSQEQEQQQASNDDIKTRQKQQQAGTFNWDEYLKQDNVGGN